MRRGMFSALVLACLLAILCPAAWSKIDPNFTPKYLADSSETIIVGPLADTGANQEWKMTVERTFKGKAAKEQVFSLADCHKDHVEFIAKALKENGKAPAILFGGEYENQKGAFMLAGTTWLEIEPNGVNRWKIVDHSARRHETYAGAADKLIAMSEYLVKDRGSTVPVAALIKWAEHMKLGSVAGASAGMAAVEIGKDRTPCLFVSATGGDKLFRPETNKDLETKWTDVTAECGLDTKSREFLWADVNGDGAADLVTWDEAALSVRFADGTGKFKAGADGWTIKLDEGCTALAPCSPGGTPGVLVSTRTTPVLLTATGTGWKQMALPAADDAMGLGEASPCIVADLDLDGYPDVLEPGEQAGLLWRGKPGGFEKPMKTAVSTGGGPAKVAVGDFDESGSLDIFLAGAQRNSLWENDGKAGFKNVFWLGGSLSYKCPSGAADVGAMDLNHDGRTDLCLVYAKGDILYHFSRGFRCFGEEGEVRLTGLEPEPGQQQVIGQIALAVADFDRAGSADLAVLLANGEVYVYLNDQYDRPALNLRLPKGAAGPVTVSCWQGEDYKVCCGTASVTGQTPAQYVVARDPGKVTLKWFMPGKSLNTVTREINVEDKTLDVTIEPASGGK